LIFCVGEQPGDQEDRAGQPFIGPAGRLLDRAFAAAGLPRESVYLTNAVKHFRFTPSGKRRIHQKPSARQVRACQPWLEAELDRVRPRIIVCLGRTAAQAVLGAHAAVSELRGRLVPTSRAEGCVVTWHPSALLRMQEERPAALAELVNALRLAREHGLASDVLQSNRRLDAP
jgi:uracil-DNA glycosylase family protein